MKRLPDAYLHQIQKPGKLITWSSVDKEKDFLQLDKPEDACYYLEPLALFLEEKEEIQSEKRHWASIKDATVAFMKRTFPKPWLLIHSKQEKPKACTTSFSSNLGIATWEDDDDDETPAERQARADAIHAMREIPLGTLERAAAVRAQDHNPVNDIEQGELYAFVSGTKHYNVVRRLVSYGMIKDPPPFI